MPLKTTDPTVKKEAKRFAKFSLVGVSNTAIDLLLFNFLRFLGANVYIATSVAFAFAVTNSYLLNRSWTFSDNKTKQPWRQYALFLLVSGVGLAINNTIVYLFLRFTHIDNQIVRDNIIRISAIGVIVFWNYGVNRFFLFKTPAQSLEEGLAETA